MENPWNKTAMMASCAKCGSSNTRFLTNGHVQRVLALILRRQAIACRRCGWQGRVRPGVGRPESRRRTATSPRPPAPVSRRADLDLQALDEAFSRHSS
jgi:hypothetical protein